VNVRQVYEREALICRSMAVQSCYRKNYRPKTIRYDCCSDCPIIVRRDSTMGLSS